MAKQFSNPAKKVLFLSLITLAAFSCKKKDDFYLNGNLPGGNLPVVAVDTLTVHMHTERRPTVETSILDTMLVGSVDDKVFGRTTATMYSQVLLYTFDKPGFNRNTKFDGTVLNLKLGSRVTGNAGDVQNWKIYLLAQDLIQNAAYYSDTSIKLGAQIGSYSGNFTGDTTISITLNNIIAQTLLADSGKSLGDNASFAALLKGIAIVPDSITTVGKGAIIPINLETDSSNITIAYHNDPSIASNYKIIFSSNAVRVNRYTHDYRGTEVQQQLDKPYANYGHVFTQNMAGLRVRVEFPYLQNLVKQGYVLLNQAQFITPVVTDSGNVAPEMTFAARDANGFSLPYSSAYPSAAYDYFYLPANKHFSIIVTRDMQTILKQYAAGAGYTDYGFNLSVPMAPYALWQNVMTTQNHPDPTKPKLILTFTKSK